MWGPQDVENIFGEEKEKHTLAGGGRGESLQIDRLDLMPSSGNLQLPKPSPWGRTERNKENS